LRVDDRGAVRPDSRGLALERCEPLVGPLPESDSRRRPICPIVETCKQPMQSYFGLLTVPPDRLLVRLLPDAYDHVIERSLRTRAPVRRLVESRPRVPQSATGGVVRLETCHGVESTL